MLHPTRPLPTLLLKSCFAVHYITDSKQFQVSKECNAEPSASARSISLYHLLKQSIRSWRAQSIWKILDERVNHSVYQGNTVCDGRRMLVIGAGPIGLRMAIECAFLGEINFLLVRLTFCC